MSSAPQTTLPAPLVTLLDGRDLAPKVGHTITLVAAEPDGWPRMALLSVGEVLTTSGDDLRLALYAASGTTAALTQSGKALLSIVLDGVAYRIRAAVERVTTSADEPLAYFIGAVARVDEDRVGYATIVSGITYELADQPRVIARWQQQIDRLRQLAPPSGNRR